MESEFEFLTALRARLPTQNSKSKIRVGIGDDCAVVRQNNQTDLVITTDLIIEDIDFRLNWTTPEFIGHKALAISLSDIAAMGGKPSWALISIGVPATIWQTDFAKRFYDGWLRLAQTFDIELAGGDVSRTPDKIVIDSIVAGEVKKNRAILRSGAKVGDLIFVTGGLGGAAGGLRLLETGLRYETATSWQKKLMLKQLCPLPQCKIGELLGSQKLATAMIDVSDGLSSDLAHLCAASKVGAKIFAERIPIHPKLLPVAKSKLESFSLALDGGEDFELLFTINPKKLEKVEKEFGNRVFRIGEITRDAGKIELISGEKVVQLQAKGFQHF